MAKLNEDGNLFGRITALAVIVAAAVWIGRICGVGPECPFSGMAFCPFSSAPR